MLTRSAGLAIALLSLSVSACTDAAMQDPPADLAADLAAPDGGGPDLPGCALAQPYSSKNATCNGCAQARCCVEVNSCFGAASCDPDYVDCYLGCGLFADPDAGAGGDGGVADCLTDCAQQHPVGKMLFDTAIGCVDQRCAVECS